jgi:hypothetical protein
MNTDLPTEELDRIAREIQRRAREAYEQFLRLLDQGVKPQTAIASIAEDFDRAYYAELLAAFYVVMGERWTIKELRAYKVGRVALSARLYEHWRQTGHHVTAIIRQHALGVQQARKLALELYQGYGIRPPGREPLKILDKLRTLPEPLRSITKDPTVRRTLIAQARRSAAIRVRTRALQSAYLQAYDAALKGVTQARLERLLEVALHEKTRYFTNRIAQTELARAHADRVARDLLADDTITVVEWTLHGRHPAADICDMFARVHKYGLGPGRYPKGKAPKPPAHPWCRCTLRSIPGWDAKDGTERLGAEREYLRELGVKEAARVLGSRTKLQRVLHGQDVRAVHNRGVLADYQVRTLGEVARRAR